MRLLIVAAVAFVGAAFAQKSTDSTGDYVMDLGEVYGAIRAVKSLQEICSSDFPHTSEPNQRAYEAWRKTNLPFVQEIERHSSAMAWRQSKGDPKQHLAILAGFDKAIDEYKAGLRQRFVSESPAAYRKQCEIYPAYLKSPRMNLEMFYSEQVATIRRGAK